MASFLLLWPLPLLSFCINLASGQSNSQACPTSLTPKNSVKPSIASGYQMALVATGLTKPRSIQFDTAGNLLVVQQGAGVEKLTFKDNGGTCLQEQDRNTVVNNNDVGSLSRSCAIVCTDLAAQSWTRPFARRKDIIRFFPGSSVFLALRSGEGGNH